ncbi:hypothetical protein EV424DRAFT_1349581 [Suillus variegatus]|nr:hypothetical protein EV424DRAFT_1349581 [Suillus variegatus]
MSARKPWLRLHQRNCEIVRAKYSWGAFKFARIGLLIKPNISSSALEIQTSIWCYREVSALEAKNSRSDEFLHTRERLRRRPFKFLILSYQTVPSTCTRCNANVLDMDVLQTKLVFRNTDIVWDSEICNVTAQLTSITSLNRIYIALKFRKQILLHTHDGTSLIALRMRRCWATMGGTLRVQGRHERRWGKNTQPSPTTIVFHTPTRCRHSHVKNGTASVLWWRPKFRAVTVALNVGQGCPGIRSYRMSLLYGGAPTSFL